MRSPPAGIAFNATHPTVPPPIAATNPPQPAGIGQPAPDRPASRRLARTDHQAAASHRPALINRPTVTTGRTHSEATRSFRKNEQIAGYVLAITGRARQNRIS